MNIKQFNGLDSFNKDAQGQEMSHEQIYTNVVNAIGLDRCKAYLPVSVDKIREALKTDKYLNNIPIKLWDLKQPYITRELSRIGINYSTLSDAVCTLKTAARMAAEGSEN